MATRDKEGEGFMNVSRRDFVKFSAAAAAVGGGWAYNTASAMAYEQDANGSGTNAYIIKNTTCPYCSASCGQRVVVDRASGKVIDIYGDFESPMNSGALCAKGAGSLQLVTNSRRIGAWPGTHPVNNTFAYDSTYADGIAYRRVGDGAWSKVSLDAAMTEIAGGLKTARDSNWDSAKYNSLGTAFLGCSHMNNESNYIYRKLIANFGSSNVEHQARI